MPHALRTLHTNQKTHTHNWQNPSILLQNETLHSKQCYLFSKWYGILFSNDMQTTI